MRVDDIQGWFTWEWLYDQAAARCGLGSRVPTFVEVGVWKGRSVAYLCRELIRRRRQPFRLIAVDTWSMERAGRDNAALNPHLDALGARGVELYDEYRSNMRQLGYDRLIHAWRMPSVEAASRFAYGQPVDFVFIDADHAAEAVEADVRAWRPRAAVLCGHDWSQASVREGLRRAGGEFFALPLMNCWTTDREMAESWESAAAGQGGRLLDAVKGTVSCPSST